MAGGQAAAPLTENGDRPGIVSVEVGQALGISSILFQTVTLMGSIPTAVGRWSLTLGSLTLTITLCIGLSVVPRGPYRFRAVVLLAGLGGDALLTWLRPSAERGRPLLLFAFAFPVALFGLYFLAIALSGGIAWSVHLWTGAIVLAGFAGLLLGCFHVAIPPVPRPTPRSLPPSPGA